MFGSFSSTTAAAPAAPTPAPTAPAPAPAEPRRLALFGATPEALLGLMRGGLVRVQSTLPADSTVHRTQVDPRTGDVIIVIESAEFDPVTEGDVIPQIQSPIFSAVAPTPRRPEPKPLAPTGWALDVTYDPRAAFSHEILNRTRNMPDRVCHSYLFESKRDAQWTEVLLSGLAVTTNVAPVFTGAQPLE